MLWLPLFASAHEAYVLSAQEFSAGLKTISWGAFAALKDPGNIKFSLVVGLGVLLALGINLWFRRTHLEKFLNFELSHLKHLGLFIVRLSVSASLFFSALGMQFLGTELSLTAFPHPLLIRAILFLVSFMLVLGLFTEAAAIIGLGLFAQAFYLFGGYMFTYANYLGEFLVLALFGSRMFSLDSYIFKPLSRFARLKEYETTIVRVCYGLALLYAAVTIKLLHPQLTLDVIRDYNLTQFHWLFPHDPLLITLGAGLTEAAIGLFIIFGFETRLTVFISLFYITLSLLFFQEKVWPHLILYGISINLIISDGGKLTLDDWLDKYFKRRKLLRGAKNFLNRFV